MTDFLLVYIQINFLLIAGYFLWLITSRAAAAFQGNVRFKRRLQLARYLFLLMLLMTVCLLLAENRALDLVIPEVTIPVINPEQLSETITSAENIYSFQRSGTVAGDPGLTIGLFEIFALGILVQLARFGFSLMHLVNVIRHASLWRRVGKIKVLFSAKAITPFSANLIFGKYVVLPYALLNSQKNLRIAIRHEIQHHRNGDLYWVMLLEVMKVLCFWNPAVYLWKKEIDGLQEYACDEALLLSGKTAAPEYGSCLLDIARYKQTKTYVACSNMVSAGALFQKKESQLKRRLKMLQKINSIRKSPFSLVVQFMVITLGVITASVFAYAQEAGEEGFVVNGKLIPARITKEWIERLPEDEKRYFPAEDYLEYREKLTSELSQNEDETSDEFTLRIATRYISSSERFMTLEAYATRLEESWSDLSVEKAALAEKIEALEKENAELRNQN